MSEALFGALFDALAAYDGRNTADLRSIQSRLGNEAGYLTALIDLAASPQGAVADGATWLLLDGLKKGATPSPDDVTRLLGKLAELTDLASWGAQLHICQSVRLLPLEAAKAAKAAQVEPLAAFLGPLLTAPKPFLRAWSLDALVHLATIDPTLKPQAREALAAAQQDKAASVKARARNLAREV